MLEPNLVPVCELNPKQNPEAPDEVLELNIQNAQIKLAPGKGCCLLVIRLFVEKVCFHTKLKIVNYHSISQVSLKPFGLKITVLVKRNAHLNHEFSATRQGKGANFPHTSSPVSAPISRHSVT